MRGVGGSAAGLAALDQELAEALAGRGDVRKHINHATGCRRARIAYSSVRRAGLRNRARCVKRPTRGERAGCRWRRESVRPRQSGGAASARGRRPDTSWSLVAGLLGALLSLAVLRAGDHRVEVAVAARELRPDEVLGAGDIRWTRVAVDSGIERTLIRRSDVDAVVGSVTSGRIRSGDLISRRGSCDRRRPTDCVPSEFPSRLSAPSAATCRPVIALDVLRTDADRAGLRRRESPRARRTAAELRLSAAETRSSPWYRAVGPPGRRARRGARLGQVRARVGHRRRPRDRGAAGSIVEAPAVGGRTTGG